MKMSLRVLGIFLVCVGFLLVQLLMSGCGGFKMQEVHTLLETKNPEAAYAYMAEKGPREDSIWADTRRFTKESGYLFERGLVAHYAKRFSESHRDFSLTENTPKKGYSGTSFEKLMRHYYQILNYVYLNRLEQALAECHRAMVYINDSVAEDEYDVLLGAGLLAHLSGMCFEAAGEWNNAFSSYQQAETHYQQAALKTEIRMPTDVGEALVRLARRLELNNEASRYLRQYGESDTHADGMGELILFYESGYVPPTSNERLTFPILQIDTTNEVFRKSNKDEETIARSFVVDTLLAREGQSYSDKDLEYVLHIDLPARSANRPYLTGIVVQTDNTQQNGVLVADIQAMALESHYDDRSALLIHTTTRVLLRYLTYRIDKSNIEQKEKRAKQREIDRKATDEEIRQSNLSPKEKAKLLYMAETADRADKLADSISFGPNTGVVSPGTGNADKRSWKMLPNQIFYVRMQLPQGTHNLTLSFLDANGQKIESQILQNVEIAPNHIAFLNYRTYK